MSTSAMQNISAAPSGDVDPFDALAKRVAAQPDLATGLDVLIEGLSARIKGTSNDQNIQRLARAIHAASPVFAAALSGKR